MKIHKPRLFFMQRITFTLCILISWLHQQIHASSCALISLPFVYGGTSSYTLFQSFDIDSNDNIVAGGLSHDSGIVNGPPKNIIVFFNGITGAVTWANYYSTPGATSDN